MNTPARGLENWPDTLKVLGLADATTLALEVIGRAIVNSCMLGVIARVTGWVKLDSIIAALTMNFEGKLLGKNEDLVRRGYKAAKIIAKE